MTIDRLRTCAIAGCLLALPHLTALADPRVKALELLTFFAVITIAGVAAVSLIAVGAILIVAGAFYPRFVPPASNEPGQGEVSATPGGSFTFKGGTRLAVVVSGLICIVLGSIHGLGEIESSPQFQAARKQAEQIERAKKLRQQTDEL